MGIENLTQLEIIDGIIGLIYPAVGILVGGTIASKYAKYKRKELLFIGLSLIIASISYFALGLTFITMVFFDYVLQDLVYFLIFIGFSAFGLLFWMYAMAMLLFPKQLKKVVLIFAVICISYEIYILVNLFINPSLIIIRDSPMHTTGTSPIYPLFNLFLVLVVIITMSMIVKELLKSEDLRTIWKGRFLLIGTILFVIGTTIIILKPTNVAIILFARIIYISRDIFSYLGWILPERVAKLLIKENEQK